MTELRISDITIYQKILPESAYSNPLSKHYLCLVLCSASSETLPNSKAPSQIMNLSWLYLLALLLSAIVFTLLQHHQKPIHDSVLYTQYAMGMDIPEKVGSPT